MLKVGVTGGIGSGKSLVCQLFRVLGVPVYLADQEARILTSHDPNIRRQLQTSFGEEIYLPGGNLDRKRLANIVFNDAKALQLVNDIIHPVVRNHFSQWASKYQELDYVLQESAIVFESGLYSHLDAVILVTAPLEMRIDRVMKRDGVTSEEVMARINNQMSDVDKIPKADYIIVNDNDNLVIPQVLNIDAELQLISSGLT